MRRLVVVLVLLALPQATPAALAAGEKTVELTILHTNDTHGHLLPFSYPDTFDDNSELARLTDRHDIGGAARRATLVKSIRHEKGRTVLLIDAGDICDGTPFSTEYHGDADVAAMNAIGYDLACPGNHEYNQPLPQVLKMMAEAKYPLISANSTVKATGNLLFKPYLIKNIGGAKVAFLGLLTYSCHTYPAAKDELTMEEPLKTARRLVPELRKQADLVIAVSHDGVAEDEQMAKEVPGIDVIVGGHSHTLLEKPIFIAHTPSGDLHSVNGTVIVQDYQWAGTLGRLDLTLHRSQDGRWTVEKYAGQLLPITSSVPADRTVQAVVDRYWKPIAPKYAEEIATAAGDFAEKGQDMAEYNLVADAVREETGAEFDLENLGGVRALLTRGPITYGDLVNMDPFGNTIYRFDVTGKQLKDLLARLRPAVSGIRYSVNGRTVIDAIVAGKPIEDDRVYHGATNSFVATGPAFKNITGLVDTKQGRLDALVHYLRAHKVVSPAYDGRRVLLNARNFDD